MNLPEFFPQQPGIELQSKEGISHEYRTFFPPLSRWKAPRETGTLCPPTHLPGKSQVFAFFSLQSQDGRYGKQSVRRAPQR